MPLHFVSIADCETGKFVAGVYVVGDSEQEVSQKARLVLGPWLNPVELLCILVPPGAREIPEEKRNRLLSVAEMIEVSGDEMGHYKSDGDLIFDEAGRSYAPQKGMFHVELPGDEWGKS